MERDGVRIHRELNDRDMGNSLSPNSESFKRRVTRAHAITSRHKLR